MCFIMTWDAELFSVKDKYMSYKLLINEPMSKHTTFKAGGNARRLYVVENIDDLNEVLCICDNENTEPLVIGNGSNILVSDKGIDIPVIEIGNGFDDIIVEGNVLRASAGAMLSKVAKAAQQNSLSGLEFASGIPGTIGGAIYMNAGAYGGEIKDVAVSVEVLKDGKVVEIPTGEMNFGYRHSRAMDEKMIITGASFKLEKSDKDKILEIMNDLGFRRREKQPLEYPSAGSTFKRPEGYFAGKLIMDSGLAGAAIGGAMVSPKHCGFIINYNDATATDIYRLIKHVQNVVFEKFNVMLDTEVKLIGSFE